MANDHSKHSEYSSSPCYSHELDENANMPDMNQNDFDLTHWRKVKREELITTRLALTMQLNVNVSQPKWLMFSMN